jgi:hypothetical protein
MEEVSVRAHTCVFTYRGNSYTQCVKITFLVRWPQNYSQDETEVYFLLVKGKVCPRTGHEGSEEE